MPGTAPRGHGDRDRLVCPGAYDFPTPAVQSLAGMVTGFIERVDTFVDDVPEEKVSACMTR